MLPDKIYEMCYSERPTYLECNPRLVESMNATLSGVNLADLTVRVALGEEEAYGVPRRGRIGIRSHSLLTILLGVADRGASRREVLHTIVENMRGRGIFAGSREDLTPVRMDPPSLVPLSDERIVQVCWFAIASIPLLY